MGIALPEAKDAIGSAMGREAYEDMLLFDSLIGNADRHKSGCGMLFGTNTGQILRMAPVIGSGLSFMARLGRAGLSGQELFQSWTRGSSWTSTTWRSASSADAAAKRWSGCWTSASPRRPPCGMTPQGLPEGAPELFSPAQAGIPAGQPAHMPAAPARDLFPDRRRFCSKLCAELTQDWRRLDSAYLMRPPMRFHRTAVSPPQDQ